MVKITCWDCSGLIAEGVTWEEAGELAEEAEAHHHRESGDWQCDGCYSGTMAYYRSQVPVLRAEAQVREQAADPLGFYLRCKG